MRCAHSDEPAALKQNVKFLKQGGVIIVDIDSFKEADLKKALFQTNEPFKELGITAQVVEVPVTSMTKAALADKGLDNKSVLKCRNIFALGLVCCCSTVRSKPPYTTCRANSPRNRQSSRPTAKCSKPATTTATTYMPRCRPTASRPRIPARACTPTSTATPPPHGASSCLRT